jgi:hypothetical protein
MQCIFVIVQLVMLGSTWTSAHAGMDSAGVSTLGGQEQTDVQTHGGGVTTSGGALDLSGGDVLDAGQVGATSVEASTIQGGNVMVTGTLSNPDSGAVTISDNVSVLGQADALRLRMSNLSPVMPQDVTPKIYVDQQLSSSESSIIITAPKISLYRCTPTQGTCCITACPPAGTFGWSGGDGVDDVYVTNPVSYQGSLFQYTQCQVWNDSVVGYRNGQAVLSWTCRSADQLQTPISVYPDIRTGKWVVSQ